MKDYVTKYSKILTYDFLFNKYVTEREPITRIATEVRCSPQIILNRLRKYDLPIRPVGQRCVYKLTGRKHGNFVGRRIGQNGYAYVCIDGRGYIREHRYVMEQHLGRELGSEEVVHHENEIVIDNRLSNLRLFPTKSTHKKYHLLLAALARDAEWLWRNK